VNVLQPQINKNEYIESIVEECISIFVENSFQAKWYRIEAYHQLGKKLLEVEFPYGSEIVSRVSKSLNIGTRTVYRAIEFAKMFPDLNMLPAGKEVSWSKIIKEYLPAKNLLQAPQKEFVFICPKCNSKYSKKDVVFVKEM